MSFLMVFQLIGLFEAASRLQLAKLAIIFQIAVITNVNFAKKAITVPGSPKPALPLTIKTRLIVRARRRS